MDLHNCSGSHLRSQVFFFKSSVPESDLRVLPFRLPFCRERRQDEKGVVVVDNDDDNDNDAGTGVMFVLECGRKEDDLISHLAAVVVVRIISGENFPHSVTF